MRTQTDRADTPPTPGSPHATEGERRPQAAGRALGAGVAALLLASLLNASALAEIAERRPHGPGRSVAVALAGAAERVSSTLWLDRPRRALNALTRRGAGASGAVAADVAPADPGEEIRELGVTPTADDPATAWIIGDSFVELFGPKLTDEFVESGVVEAEVDFRFITGLSRPDVFDWPAHVRKRMQADPPDIVVAMFGGNDGQPVALDGVRYVEYTEDWWLLYRRRVGEVMDALFESRVAYWVGLPVMKDPDFREHARQFNQVYRQEAERREWMRYLPSWELFTDDRGAYADYLPNHNGDMRLMRYADGAHFTPSGALRLARHVFGVIAEEWRIPAEP